MVANSEKSECILPKITKLRKKKKEKNRLRGPGVYNTKCKRDNHVT